jgi:mannose-6-phosphate isomerase-like protein (cupin superfamily)
MIVEYEPETVTGMHMHPNAESMFVILTGKSAIHRKRQGRDTFRVVRAAHFPATDRHGLRGAEAT